MCYQKPQQKNALKTKQTVPDEVIQQHRRQASDVFSRLWENAANYPPLGCMFITLVLAKTKFYRPPDQRNPFINFIDNKIHPKNELHNWRQWRQWETCAKFVMDLFLFILTNIHDGTIQSQDYLGYDRMKVVQCIRFRLTEFMFRCYSDIRDEHFSSTKNEGPLFKNDCAQHIIHCHKLMCQYLEWLVLDPNQLMTFGLNEHSSEELKKYNLFVAFYLLPETTFYRHIKKTLVRFHRIIKYKRSQYCNNIMQHVQFDFYDIIDRLFSKLDGRCEFVTARLASIRDISTSTGKTIELDMLAQRHNNLWAQQILCDHSFNSNMMADYTVPLWYHCLGLISCCDIFPKKLIHPLVLYKESFMCPMPYPIGDFDDEDYINMDHVIRELINQCDELFNPKTQSSIDLNYEGYNLEEFDTTQYTSDDEHSSDGEESCVLEFSSSSSSSSSDSESDSNSGSNGKQKQEKLTLVKKALPSDSESDSDGKHKKKKKKKIIVKKAQPADSDSDSKQKKKKAVIAKKAQPRPEQKKKQHTKSAEQPIQNVQQQIDLLSKPIVQQMWTQFQQTQRLVNQDDLQVTTKPNTKKKKTKTKKDK